MIINNDNDIEMLIKTHADYHAAPLDLINQISSLNKPQKVNHAWKDWFGSFDLHIPQLAGGAMMGAILATLVTSKMLTDQASKESMYLALLAEHTQAIVNKRTIEVQSSNQHTVKPWLSSQLGYSPQVVDLSEKGFPLVGGRRGFVGTTPVAVAVYAYKQHEIDVYVMTKDIYQLFPANLKPRNGYNLNSWSVEDLQYVVVSDASESLLKQFSKALANKQGNL